jgi:spore coat protein A
VDGEPEAWFNPVTTTQAGGSSVGPTYCSNTYKYPNIRAAGTLWYHDHVVGMTRQNVFAGLAGFYLLQPAAGASLALDVLFPGVYDFPLAIQDRSFKQHKENVDAGLKEEVCLCYSTDTGANGLGLGTWEPEWAGRVAVVNGKVWPVMQVAARPYRFRLLAGANARAWNLQLRAVEDNIAACDAALRWYQIGTEGGLYSASRCAPCMRMCASHRIAFAFP